MPAEPVSHIIASIDRAGDHAAVLGVVIVAAVIGGLIYGLVRLAARSRAGRARSVRDRRHDA
jgi:hypothetical protein